ncbi:MAG: LPS export ABC transporter permease LptF [Thermodesulfobacteriota bacterium]
MKPTALDRYVFTQFLPYFAVSIIFFTSVFLTHELLDIIDFVVNYNVAVVAVLLIMLYSMPYFLGYVIPISTMIAVLLAFLRISGDNEVTAIRSSGISVYRLLYPVAVFSLGAALLTALVSVWMLPRGKTALKALTYKTITSSPAMGLKEQEFISNFSNLTIYISGLDKKTNALAGIFIEDRQTTDQAVTVCAPSGYFTVDPETGIFRLNLLDGLINQARPDKKTFQSICFKRYAVNLDLQKPIPKKYRHKDEREMTFTELREYLKTGDRNTKDYFQAQLEYHKKFSIPFACLALGILAVSLGIQTHSARKSSGIGLALVCFLVYYLLLSAGEIFSEKGTLTPAMGMWMPNTVMSALAVYLIVITANDRGIRDEINRIYRYFFSRG